MKRCRCLGVKQTHSRHRGNDASDPQETFAALDCCSAQRPSPQFADRHRYAVISLTQRMEAAVAAKGPNSAKSQSCGTISGRWEELRATYPKRIPPRGPVTAITKCLIWAPSVTGVTVAARELRQCGRTSERMVRPLEIHAE